MKYVLGLDLGITSIGWCLMLKDDSGEFIRIEDLGVKIFTSLENKDGKLENQTRREKRGQRRLRRRKLLRINDTNALMQEKLDIIFKKINFKNYNNPYEIKIKGLSEALTKEELAIIMHHYVKYRGFKSNRKVEDAKKEGKLLSKLDDVEQQLINKNITITQYLYNNFLAKDKNERRIHNSSDEYLFSATRKMYIDEINKIFDKQIELNTIDEDLKTKFLNIFERQRSFSEGPASNSPYASKNGISLIEKMIGKCGFDELPRAAKGAFSSESFVFLSFLNNLRFKEKSSENYRGLNENEIKEIYNLALEKSSITYKALFKTLKINVEKVKDMSLSKNDYIKLMKEFKEKNSIQEKSLNEDELILFKEKCLDYLFSKKLPSLVSFHEQKKILLDNKKTASKKLIDEIDQFLLDNKNFDLISTILLTRKSDDEIANEVIKNGYSQEFANIITSMPTISKTINLSLDICNKLVPNLLKAFTYDKSMEMIGHDFTKPVHIEKHDYLPSIDECLEKLKEKLSNVVVKHTLVEVRKIINAIIKKYGYISSFSIEYGRDIAKGHKERNRIKFTQRENMDVNIGIRQNLLSKYPNIFKNFKDIKSEDVLKYKLYREQNYKCAYSNENISENELFDGVTCQIDHIIPYSIGFDDSHTNKVLVFTKYNQEKKNRIPFDAFKGDRWQKILDFINNPNVNISERKKDLLLSKEVSEDWKKRNLNDTRYITKLTARLLNEFLKPENVISVNGTITDCIKKAYGLFGLTHSYIDSNYKTPTNYYIVIESIFCEKDMLKFDLSNHKTGHIINLGLKKIPENKKNIKNAEIELNKTIDYFYHNQGIFIDYLYKAISIKNDITSITTHFAEGLNNAKDANASFIYENLLNVLAEAHRTVNNYINEKDRNNHLHHCLDACVIAIADLKMINKIQKFYKQKETLIDDETGEIVRSPKLTPPYENFRNEVIIKIYERDETILAKKLKSLGLYQNNHVLLPVKSVNKNIKGAFTEETLLGCRNGVITKKMDVKSLKESDIDKIINQGGGSNAVIESIKDWFKNGDKTNYPILKGKGNYIKKVSIIEGSKCVMLKEGIYANNTSVIRVDFYRKEGKSGYFMVPIYYYQLVREENKKKGKEKNKPEIKYEVMWKSGDNGSEFISSTKLKNEYRKVFSLPRNTLIEIELISGVKGLAYSGGATSGKFEVYSILGDLWDLKNSNIISSFGDGRIRLVISNIKNIKVRNISLLGELN